MGHIVAHTKPILALLLVALVGGCGPLPFAEMTIPSVSPTDTIHDPVTSAPAVPVAPALTATPDGGLRVGQSVQGRPIMLYRLGTGRVTLLLIGGMHGGYEWNTIALAYAMIDHFDLYPEELAGASLLIVPDANPDGLFAVSGQAGRISAGDIGGDTLTGRVNAHGVDLNRNWGCNWQPSGQWEGGQINGGSQSFSEPETQALRDLILREHPGAVVFWHSASGAAYGGGCGSKSVYDASKKLALNYALAAGYDHGGTFTTAPGGYPITGDASNWVSRSGIPSITVELTTHISTELTQNLAGVRALIAAMARTR